MKRIKTLILLAFLTVSAGTLQADAAAAPPPPPELAHGAQVDPTQQFFMALAHCTGGWFQETNILAATFGPAMLRQFIRGENKGVCEATLETPDGRDMGCRFNVDELGMLADPHFLSGILSNNIDNPSEESLRADSLWSQFKAVDCSLQ